jgi:hypothetical protein
VKAPAKTSKTTVNASVSTGEGFSPQSPPVKSLVRAGSGKARAAPRSSAHTILPLKNVEKLIVKSTAAIM